MEFPKPSCWKFVFGSPANLHVNQRSQINEDTALSHGDISNDLDGPLTQLSRFVTLTTGLGVRQGIFEVEYLKNGAS